MADRGTRPRVTEPSPAPDDVWVGCRGQPSAPGLSGSPGTGPVPESVPAERIRPRLTDVGAAGEEPDRPGSGPHGGRSGAGNGNSVTPPAGQPTHPISRSH